MALTSDDLPVNPDELEDAADTLMIDVGDSENALIILGQLDAYEIVITDKGGVPRWSEDQQDLILKAGRVLKELRES